MIDARESSVEFLANAVRNCRDVIGARQIHAKIVNSRHSNDHLLLNLLIDMYGKCGCVLDARQIFDRIDGPNVFSWNIVLAAYARNGHLLEAKALFDRMPYRSPVSWSTMIAAYIRHNKLFEAHNLFDCSPNPDIAIFNTMIAAYARIGDLTSVETLFKKTLQKNVITWTLLLQAYAWAQKLQEAIFVFKNMPMKNVVSWTTMIQAYARGGYIAQAQEIFDRMPERNHVSWSVMIEALAEVGNVSSICSMILGASPTIRQQIPWSQKVLALLVPACKDKSQLRFVEEILFSSEHRENPYLANAIILRFGAFECRVDACRVFGRMESRNVFSWCLMVNLFSQAGDLQRAKEVFDGMPQKTIVCWNSILSAYLRNEHCASSVEILFFKSMPEWDVVSFNIILAVYAQSKRPKDAKHLFDTMPEHTLVSWTALVQAYSLACQIDAAKHIFERMPERNSFSWNIMISAYGAVKNVSLARRVFDSMPEHCRLTSNTILSACALAGDIAATMSILDAMHERDCVTYDAIVQAFAVAGHVDESQRVVAAMPKWSSVSFNAVFAATCAEINGTERLKRAFAIVPEPDIVTWTMLVQSLAEKGHVDAATRVFESVPCERNVVLWTAMVASHAHSGRGKETLDFFRRMELEGVEANQVSWICVLNSCSHGGLLDEACACLASMVRDHSVILSDQLYGSLVDLLSRCGELRHAGMIARNVSQGSVSWRTVLGACRVYGDLECGRQAASNLFHENLRESTAHVLIISLLRWDNSN